MVSTIRPPYFCVPLLNEDRLPRDRPRLSAAAPYGIAVCLTQSIQGHHHMASIVLSRVASDCDAHCLYVDSVSSLVIPSSVSSA